MGKNVVFAGNAGGIEFHKKIGYLKSLEDQGAITGSLLSTDIWKPEDLDFFAELYNEKGIKDALKGMELPERYILLKAEVADEAKLQEMAKKFCERYEMQFKIY